MFKTTRIRRNLGKTIPRKNHSAIEFLLVEEFATTILEFTNHRFVDHAVAAVRPIQTPLVSFGIVQAQSHALDVARRPADIQLKQTGPAIPDLADDRGAVVLDPLLRAG